MKFDQVVMTNVYLDDLNDLSALTRSTLNILVRRHLRAP